MRRDASRRRMTATLVGVLLAVALAMTFSGSAAASAKPTARGALDCNGFSPIQQTIKASGLCTDVRGFPGRDRANIDDGRFYDNGHYIGHDEPDLTFLSDKPGSGNDVTWTETLGQDPAAAPTVGTPGSDVTHWFELSIAPWFSMALCNPNSYPQAACKPMSDSNAPHDLTGHGSQGGGSSFLEVQFYSTGRGAVLRQHQLRQRALVRLAAHQRPRMHRGFPQVQQRVRGADELRVDPEERHSHRSRRAAGRDHRDVHAGQPDAADESRRHPEGPHLRRCTRGGWSRARSGDRRHDDRTERIHAGIRGQRLHGHEDGQLQRRTVQLRARVHRLPSGGTSSPGQRCKRTSARSSRSGTGRHARHCPIRPRATCSASPPAIRSRSHATGRTRRSQIARRTTPRGLEVMRSATRRVTSTLP